MNQEPVFSSAMSRRDFNRLLMGGAASLGGAVLLGACGRPQEIINAETDVTTAVNVLAINGSADGNLVPAVRLQPPQPQPKLFLPWAAGETVYEAPNDQNMVAFRIDDGPWPVSTHKTQEIFSSFGIGGLINPTTIAMNVKNYPDAALEYIANGNVLINHSYSHQYTDAINASEIEFANNIIEQYTGQRPEIYAVPGLGEGPKITAEATRLNMPITSTRVFVGDTDPKYIRDVEHIVAAAIAQIRSGSIIVVHPETDSHVATRQALPRIIEHVMKYFVPVQMKTLLFTRYNYDGTRKGTASIIRKNTESWEAYGRQDGTAMTCCGR